MQATRRVANSQTAGFPSAFHHCAAVLRMTLGATTPDPKSRTVFDQVIDHYDEHEEYEL